MIQDYKMCCTCAYEDKSTMEEPCIHCQNNFVEGTKEHEDSDLEWTPAGKDKATMVENLINNMNDPVNHPNHYTNGGMECIDEMRLVFGDRVVANFCLCNAWKYRYRAIYKNGEEDMKKSHWYMAKYAELKEEEELF